MSFGRMNRTAFLAEKQPFRDREGFTSMTEVILKQIRVYREGRHGSIRWANLAAFSDATDLFRMRVIPWITVKPGQIIILDSERFEILSVEDVKGRDMYLELLAKKVVAING